MKIPEDRIPYKVTVNGVTTVLESGAELTVSASVQDAIEATEDFPADPLPVDKPWECGYPAPKSGDAGKVLTVGEDGKPGWSEASGGTEVVANPTLAGTEADLTGLQVGDTKYKVPAGGGGGGGALVVNLSWNEDFSEATCDKTASEMLTAARSGLVIIHTAVENAEMNCPVTIANLTGETYTFSTANPAFRFEANGGDSYPISSDK